MPTHTPPDLCSDEGCIGMERQKKKIETQVENEELVRKKHAQIVQAAGELFSRKGYHSTSMRDISAASGINVSYIYKYISSKDDILYLYYTHLHEQWLHLFEALVENTDENPVDQIRLFMKTLLDLVHELKKEVLTMYTESRHLERDSRHSILYQEKQTVSHLEQLIRRGMSQGYFTCEDSFMAANIIHYMTTIEPLRGWNFRERYSHEQFVDLMIDNTFRILGIKDDPDVTRRVPKDT